MRAVRDLSARMEADLLREECRISVQRRRAAGGANVSLTLPPRHGKGSWDIDLDAVQRASEIIVTKQLSLEETVRLWRGQTVSDPRPNKALCDDHLEWLLHGYDQQDTVLATIRHGVQHQFLPQDAGRQNSRPQRNHKSATAMSSALHRSIREGQDAGTYLVIRADAVKHWKGLVFSPFGCVAKAGVDPQVEARVIHDLSFPFGCSTNDLSQKNLLPRLVYAHVRAIARRIIALRDRYPSTTVKMMRGDVKSAFRHLFGHESTCSYFVGYIPDQDVVVVDLALPFGWTGSPAHYGTFGSAISFLTRRECPATLRPGDQDTNPFFCYEWVDDHVLVEADQGDRLELCDVALRLAMLAILGPRAINEKKFTAWSTRTRALGLDWDTTACTVSMPEDKIAKAHARVGAILEKTSTTRTLLNELLGSLRHVCSCIRPAKAFFQRIVSLQRRAPRVGTITIDAGARLDLMWFQHILSHGRLRGVPRRYFADLPPPAVHIYMDASNEGLCVLNPANKQFLRLRFDSDEVRMIQQNSFTINVREQFSAVLALLCWGQDWIPSDSSTLTHIRFWIDNRSAVSWCNSLASHAACAQELNRIIGAVEASHNLRVSAEHLPGSLNALADLGSRAWTGASLTKWNLLTSSWSQTDIPARIRKIYSATLSPFSTGPSPTRQESSTRARGDNGAASVDTSAHPSGSRPTGETPNPYSWLSSPFTVGVAPATSKVSPHEPFCPRLATSAGIIAPPSASTRSSFPTTSSLFAACEEQVPHQEPGVPSPSPCFRGSSTVSTSGIPITASLVGLRFYFLLRSSEYLARPAWSLESAKLVKVHFRGSKTDQEGQGITRSLTLSGHATLCPVRAAVLLLHHAAEVGLKGSDPICSLGPSRVLKAEVLARLIRAAAVGTGSDSSNFSCHSLRSGGATALLASGVDSTIVMLHGRWRSDVFHRYTRLTSTTSAAIARRMTTAAPEPSPPHRSTGTPQDSLGFTLQRVQQSYHSA